MSERTRKRVFRRSLQRFNNENDSQAVLQKLIDETNVYIILMTELEAELQRQSGQAVKTPREEPEPRGVTGTGVEAGRQRLDAAVAFLLHIADLDKQPAQHLKKVENPEQRDNATAEPPKANPTEAGGEDDQGRLWDDFVTQRAAKTADVELVKGKKKKSRLRKFVARIFRKRKA